MAPLNQPQKDILSFQILKELSSTSYACSSLIPLSGGTANFVYRGTLISPLNDRSSDGYTNMESVIVKHSTAFAAVNTSFELDVERCVYEEAMLKALATFSPSSGGVKVPKPYYFNKETNTQIHEDIPDTTDFKTVLLSASANTVLNKEKAFEIGNDLGSWLKSFHSWTSMPEQKELRKVMRGNEGMRKLKFDVGYGGFIGVLELFPALLSGNARGTLEKVRRRAIRDFENPPESEGWGIVHGDFWTGNVLLRDPIPSRSQSNTLDLTIIDFELAHFGHHAIDLGQMIADLYERYHFLSHPYAQAAIQGFIQGYGPISEDLAFRTAIHAGVHLIFWYKRGNPKDPKRPWATPEKIEGCLRVGNEWIIRGWESDRRWFQEGNDSLKWLFKTI